ncbi:MAG: phosphoenolpyruvate synthase, partial [Desulfohalobiaceae bacterium]|nr:phosphoenolpyruvate synthase [Desulfohalobiaceae bacterium]
PAPAEKLLLTGRDIMDLGEEAELLVGGKNYNTARISQIEGIKSPQFRAISSAAFHFFLDEARVDGDLIQKTVDKEYEKTNWSGAEANADPDFLKNLVRRLGRFLQDKQQSAHAGSRVSLREFIKLTVSGFADTREGIDRLRKRSVLVQTAIMSVPLPDKVREVAAEAYRSICREAGMDQVQVAVRSSAAGEDSRKKAFAGLQDTYLNITSAEDCVLAYQWDCASAYNLRSMTYRREAIRDASAKAKQTGDTDPVEEAKREWGIENTSLSVCIMRMIDPVVSGTAFSADTATGCRGRGDNDLVSMDSSYGLGEAVVSGLVTPDKCYCFQRDDGQEVVIRQMGVKDKEIVYDPDKGGTRVVSVPEEKQYRWSLSMDQAGEVARGVRAISRAYSGIIMDTEFCIDQWGDLWFVQARPETRWNADFEQHPQTIFMRRQELDPEYMDRAEVILKGNGASRGAGSGRIKFLRSALELNKIEKGDILAAERTDPDMVPGMRIASAILASAGGDTSHAAITSRELGIPSVIGINKTEVLRALDGQEATVDGSSGMVYRGIRPLIDIGGEIDVGRLPLTRTKVGLILADVGQAMFLSRLRQSPDFEIGLLRAEFMLGNIGVHPLALHAYDQGTLSRAIREKLMELENELTKKIREQLAFGILTFDLNLRKYVGIISGLDSEIEHLQEEARVRDKKEAQSLKKRILELERRLDGLLEKATQRLDVLKTSTDLGEHIAQVMGFKDLLVQLNDLDPEERQKRHEIEDQIAILKERSIEHPEVRQVLERIHKLRHDVSQKIGLNQTMDEVRQLPEKIRQIFRQKGYRSGRELYIQSLAQGLALFAMAFSGREVIYRTTDFKSNEYRNLVGGMLFETFEDNPMLGYRGVSRNLHDWEIRAFKLARNSLGGRNLHLMLPFVRTLEEARSMKRHLSEVHNLRSHEDGLKIIQMSEIPSNGILAKEFIREFDGFSIGSNDMTQLVLGTDRDNPRLQKVYDEEDPAVVWAILVTIFTGQKQGKKVGFCGQGVSNSKIIRGLVCIAGIVSASVVPDSYAQTKQDIHELEQEKIPVSKLGSWLKEQHLRRLIDNMENNHYGHILKQGSSPKALHEWYTGEISRLHSQIKASAGTPREDFYRQELEMFRTGFHKSVIYANWDWETTIRDALHQAGFSGFEEQAGALKRQREHLEAENVLPGS